MKGFFSIMVVGLLMVALLAVIYSQQSSQQSRVQSMQAWAIQQTLAREWAMARNAYSQFASDAIAARVDGLVPTQSQSNCISTNLPVLTSNEDYSNEIASAWNDANIFMQQHFDVNCSAIISPVLEQQINSGCTSPPTCGKVSSEKDIFVLLSCRKLVDGREFGLSHPFTLNKKIELQWDSILSQCHVRVLDNMTAVPPAMGTVVEVDPPLT